MSEVQRAYYIAGGRALESIKDWNARRIAASDAYTAFFEKVGIRYATGTSTGHKFQMEGGNQPKVPGLRLVKYSRAEWLFDRKTPEGKALAKEWESIYYPRESNLNVGAGRVMHDMHIYHPTCELIGETWVLSCPYLEGKNKPTPHDSTPVKTSEYWAMKEALAPKPQEVEP